MEWILIIIFFYVAIGVFSWARETISNSERYLKLKPKLDSLEKSVKEHELKVEKDEQKSKQKDDQWNAKKQKDIEELRVKLENVKNELRLESKQLKEEKQKYEDSCQLKLKKDVEEEQEYENSRILKIQSDDAELEKIARQKSMGFPWLAEAYADYFSLRDLKRAKSLESKNHPALTAAETVREIKKEKRELLRNNKIALYKLNYFQKLFPWLEELLAENEDEEIPVRIDDNEDDDNEDRVKDFLTPEEYKKLPSVERNQKALDRYLLNRNKSKWAIGRDYEMYVGYLYEQRGYAVEYKGIIDGFEDLGRDVIATKNKEVCIIQCKYWAQYKDIHEKHVFQLFGTTMEYWIKNFKNSKIPKTFEEFAKFLNENKLRPIFFTSTTLSEKAREMAIALSVEIVEREPIGDFPRIKCNISTKDGEKIYHLPFDQQYDRTIIGDHVGEFHAFTVKEAEDAGFRRAFKHRF